MSLLILVVAFGLAVTYELFLILQGRATDEAEHEAARLRVLRELRDIELHRPEMICSTCMMRSMPSSRS